uniref:Uncharacterized protein n=1 Tax=Solanum lycopersicum TaxID=4081 RepID=A0A3Q7FX88_SOLLC
FKNKLQVTEGVFGENVNLRYYLFEKCVELMIDNLRYYSTINHRFH